MKLSDLIVTDAIIPQLASTTRDEAVAELITALSDTGAIDAEEQAGLALVGRVGHGVRLAHGAARDVSRSRYRTRRGRSRHGSLHDNQGSTRSLLAWIYG